MAWFWPTIAIAWALYATGTPENPQEHQFDTTPKVIKVIQNSADKCMQTWYLWDINPQQYQDIIRAAKRYGFQNIPNVKNRNRWNAIRIHTHDCMYLVWYIDIEKKIIAVKPAYSKDLLVRIPY